MLNRGELGIHPPGALGVGFFVHARAESLIGRAGGGITMTLRELGVLHLLQDGRERFISLKDRVFANFLEAEARDRLPELVLICCNPIQLKLITGELVRFLESLAERQCLRNVSDIHNRVPIFLIMPNGIVVERTVEEYAEQLRESVLLERMPGVSEEMVRALLDRIVRGISLQAGGRRGWGADTVYIIERKGSLLFAGGGGAERDRIEQILTAHDYPFVHKRNVSGTRIEFDKAMISIVLNVGGLIRTVRPDGQLIDLRMGDLCKDPEQTEFVETLARAVFDVGKEIGAYAESETFDEIWSGHRTVIMKFAGHVTSSIKEFNDKLANGLDRIELFSNEEWLLKPLVQYAAKAGLKAEEKLFRNLIVEVQQSMACAIKYRERAGAEAKRGTQSMKMAAQRSINFDLFDDGGDDIIVVGTMLDTEHLIKMEMRIHLPDEQIIRASLDMIRAPFPVCTEVESAVQRLVGLRIEPGVLNEISRRVGGNTGCMHIRELGTGIVQFVASALVRSRAGMDIFNDDHTRRPPEEHFKLTKDLLCDSCLAYSQTTPLGLDEAIGIKRVGEDHRNEIPLGDYEPSLGAVLFDRAERWDDKVYLRFRKGLHDHAVTWREFADQTKRIAENLIEMGIKPGDRIAMFSENRVEMYIFEMALWSIGAISVPIFAGYPAPQAAYVLQHSQPKYLVVSNFDRLDRINRANHPSIKSYYCMDFDGASADWGAVDFATLLSPGNVSEDEFQARLSAVKPDDLALIMYTSGTTGPPKGVKLTHRNLISQQKAISLIWDVDTKDVFLSYLPWHHSFGGLFERFMTLYNGCELCLDDSRGRDADRLIENWKLYDPTIFFSVPRVHDLLTCLSRERPAVHELVFNRRLRLTFTAGAPLSATVEAVYRKNKIPVLEGWGLTETSPCVTVTRIDHDWRSGYVGFPIPGVTIRIGSDQEILVKGPNVMPGYLDDEDATSRVIDAKGWFHTGDLGEYTRHGVRIFGRQDGAFKLTTGEKVHPQRIENTLTNESKFIASAVVVGRGENFVSALIYPDFMLLRDWAREQGIDASEGVIKSLAVRELFESEIARINPLIDVKYQRIKRAVVADRDPSLGNGELTPTGKMVRQRVFDTNRREIEALFRVDPPEYVIEVKEHQLQGS